MASTTANDNYKPTREQRLAVIQEKQKTNKINNAKNKQLATKAAIKEKQMAMPSTVKLTEKDKKIAERKARIEAFDKAVSAKQAKMDAGIESAKKQREANRAKAKQSNQKLINDIKKKINANKKEKAVKSAYNYNL